jgi:hypothetical protein
MKEPKPIENAVKAAEAPAAGLVARLEAEVEKWWNDARGNLGAVDIEVHNRLHFTKEALKTRLRSIFS